MLVQLTHLVVECFRGEDESGSLMMSGEASERYVYALFTYPPH